MSAPQTVLELRELIEQSGLLPADALEPFFAPLDQWLGTSDEQQILVDRLVQERLLTQFQSRQLLMGRRDCFFLTDKYKVLEFIGEGGMGKVYLCEHLILQRLVAAKLLRHAEGDMDTHANSNLERFYREARAVATLDHPNIVRVFDVDRAGAIPFMLMEYVDGTNLHDLVTHHGKLPFQRSAQYIMQAASGLEHAHRAGLIHRDIKPSNFIVDRNGIVKLLDLGLARFSLDTSKNRGITTRYDGNVVMGTVDYMAPEQAIDSSAIDIRSDIYSLGCTLYFLLSGRPPFVSGSLPQRMYAHQTQIPEPVCSICPDVPPALSDVVDRMLKKAASDRYQTPGEIVQALKEFAGDQAPPAPEEMPRIPSSYFRLGLSHNRLSSPSAATPNPIPREETQRLPRDQAWNTPAPATARKRTDPFQPPVPEPIRQESSFVLQAPPTARGRGTFLWVALGCLAVALVASVLIWRKASEDPNSQAEVRQRPVPSPSETPSRKAKVPDRKETSLPIEPSGPTLKGGGSTLAERMMALWGSEYEKQKGVHIKYESVGSGKGSQGVIGKAYVFGCSDAPVSDKQLADARQAGGELIHIPLLMGAVVPCYNLSVDKPLRFTGPILADIYLGKIRNWNNQALQVANPGVALPDMPITVVARKDPSGTSFIWTDFLSKASGEWRQKLGPASTLVDWPTGIRADHSDGVAAEVSRTVGAICYVELSWALENNLPVGHVKNRAGTFVEPKLESVTAAAAGSLAEIPSDLRYSLTDAPGKQSYPISGTTWAIIYADQTANPQAAELVDFLHWATHDGQAYLKDLKFAELPPELVKRIEERLAEVKRPAK